MTETVSALLLPLVLLLSAVPMLLRRRDYFAVFTEGAREGATTALRLFPTMLSLTVALSMFQASGAVEFLSRHLAGVAGALGLPPEILPLIVTRPVSGSASTAAFVTLLDTVGADSFVACLASVIMGSSDTLIYVLSVYFSGTAVGKLPPVKDTRHAVPAAVLTALFGLFFAAFVSRLFFEGGA